MGVNIMGEEFKEFYDALKENLSGYDGEYASFIDYGPALYKLLSNLLMFYGKYLSNEDKLKISAAIAYYVVPLDVIPEQIYGPYGYVDDIFISVYVLKIIIDKYGIEISQKLWDEEEDLEEVIKECYDKSIIVLEDTDKILEYVGLI